MYIFELLVQAFKGKKYIKKSVNPLEDISKTQEEEEEDCNHCFFPLDSSQEYFACKFCGKIVHKSKLKDKNIFRRKP